MKHYTTIFTLWAFLGAFPYLSFGQGCFPNTTFQSEPFGFYPAGPMTMNCDGLSASKTFVTLTDTIVYDVLVGNSDTVSLFMGATRILSVSGLPNGLSLTTDVINSATLDSPFGTWLHPGGVHSLTPAVGCISIVGDSASWYVAGSGGPNNDGVFPLIIAYDTRLDSSYLSINQIVPHGSWLENIPEAFGGGLRTLELELSVNENSCSNNLFASVAVTADDNNSPECNGVATVNVYNGTPPYMYNFSNGVTTQSAGGLCPGIYNVQVTDALGTQALTQFGVASSIHVYSNVPSNVPTGIDTLYGSISSCDLDYTLPIDSFQIANSIIVANDTLLASWIVWQGGVPFTVTTIYPYTNHDPTVFSTSLWCLNGRSEAGVFQLFELHSPPVGIRENAEILTSVRPNPSSGIFEISLVENRNVCIRVLDFTGKTVLSGRKRDSALFKIDITDKPNGIYILEIEGSKGKTFKRLIKQ